MHIAGFSLALGLILPAAMAEAQTAPAKDPAAAPPPKAPAAQAAPAQKAVKAPAPAAGAPKAADGTVVDPATAGGEAAPAVGSAPAAGTAPALAPGAPATKNIKNIKRKKRRETTDSVLKKRGGEGPSYVVGGEAQLLPAKVVRFRYVLQNVSGDSGFDEDGKELSIGGKLAATGHAFALEYGITDRLAFQMIVPIVGGNELAIDADKFRTSSVYDDAFQELIEEMAPTLIQQGFCSDNATCRAAVDTGLKFSVDTPVELPTGETVTIKAGVPIKAAADSLIVNGLRPASGKTGLGDVTLGLAYNIYSSPSQNFTMGMGLRLPTGAHENVPAAYRAPGSGFLTSGFVVRYDYRLFNPMLFSFGNNFEYHLNKITKQRSSLIDNTKANEADPTVDNPAIPGKGDGIANDEKIERKGVANIGFFRLSFAMGALAKFLNPVGVYAYYNWKIEPSVDQGGSEYDGRSELYTVTGAISFDGLGLQPRIPVNLTVQHETPISGKNTLLAPVSDTYQFILYYKF